MKTMKTIKGEYTSVHNHRGIDIWILKEVNPSKGDNLKYMTKTISGEEYFNTVQEAVDTIERDWE